MNAEQAGRTMPVSKNRRSKVVSKRPAANPSGKAATVAELPDRRVMERYLAALTGRPEDESIAAAQDVMYGAWQMDSARARIAAAHKALALSPVCADAYNLLAEEATSAEQARDLYARAVEAGERALGPQGFEEYAGHFWGFLETRPYMRARAGLAGALQRLGDDAAAIGHYREMLKLNPNDNQGVRDVLAALLLKRDDIAALKQLLGDYADDDSAMWTYTQALLAFRDGGAADENALKLVQRAWSANEHVPGILSGRKPGVALDRSGITVGGADEATVYVQACGAAWRRTQGAIAWLSGVVSGLPPKRRRGGVMT
jgi:tetratricopeptide (TPR) repeat protein